jgi:hypothetical protein
LFTKSYMKVWPTSKASLPRLYNFYNEVKQITKEIVCLTNPSLPIV